MKKLIVLLATVISLNSFAGILFLLQTGSPEVRPHYSPLGYGSFMTGAVTISIYTNQHDSLMAIIGLSLAILDSPAEVKEKIKAKLVQKFPFLDSEQDLNDLSDAISLKLETLKEKETSTGYYVTLKPNVAQEIVNEFFLNDQEKELLIKGLTQ